MSKTNVEAVPSPGTVTPKVDFNILLLPAVAEILTAEAVPDRVREIRFNALKQLRTCLNFYQRRGYTSKLLCGIAEKKSKMILSATTASDMDKLARPRCPYYDGNRFIPDEYSIPEEELICWSETSLLAPLNEAGCKRYMEVFQQIFPEESIKFFGTR